MVARGHPDSGVSPMGMRMKMSLIVDPRRVFAGLQHARGAATLLARDPHDGLDRIRKRVRTWGGVRYHYALEGDWEERLHQVLGHPWPCPAANDFSRLWPSVVATLAAQGLAVGRGTYGGWDDGNCALARVVWCLTQHVRPRRVVETGVARGITTRCILEGLERNGDGHLWSIDLPALNAGVHDQIGAAVPAPCRRRWTYLQGSSRQHLPSLLAALKEIDMFVHDSLHTERNLCFEMDEAWRALRPGGVLIADDIQLNWGFGSFTRSVSGGQWLVGQHDDRQGLFGVVIKEPGRLV